MTWKQALVECQKIEVGRTTLASIENKNEQESISKSDIPDVYGTWTAGVMIPPLQKWFWYKDNGEQVMLKQVTSFFWNSGQPDGDKDGYCMNIFNVARGRKWNDFSCENKLPALCEIRC